MVGGYSKYQVFPHPTAANLDEKQPPQSEHGRGDETDQGFKSDQGTTPTDDEMNHGFLKTLTVEPGRENDHPNSSRTSQDKPADCVTTSAPGPKPDVNRLQQDLESLDKTHIMNGHTINADLACQPLCNDPELVGACAWNYEHEQPRVDGSKGPDCLGAWESPYQLWRKFDACESEWSDDEEFVHSFCGPFQHHSGTLQEGLGPEQDSIHPPVDPAHQPPFWTHTNTVDESHYVGYIEERHDLDNDNDFASNIVGNCAGGGQHRLAQARSSEQRSVSALESLSSSRLNQVPGKSNKGNESSNNERVTLTAFNPSAEQFHPRPLGDLRLMLEIDSKYVYDSSLYKTALLHGLNEGMEAGDVEN